MVTQLSITLSFKRIYMMKKQLLISLSVGMVMSSEWSQSIDFGLVVSQGNSESSLINLNHKAEKKWDNKEFSAFNSFNHGTESNDTTLSQFFGNALFTINKDTYFTRTRLDYRNDDVADISYKASLVQSLGKNWLSSKKHQFSSEIGLGYGAESVSSNHDNYVQLFYGHEYELKITEDSSLVHDLNFFTPLDDGDNFSVISNVGLKNKITDGLALSISLQSRYENQVATGVDRHDLLLVSGVSFSF